MKKVLFGMALGAALSYLFDPQLGVRRREQLRERLDRSSGGGTVTDAAEIDIVMFDDRTPAGVS
jgi:hypothetical protein